jgi:hypothetical protein
VSYPFSISNLTIDWLNAFNSCTKRGEIPRYQWFIKVANAALALVKPLAPASAALDIIFLRNDLDIYGDHGNPSFRTRQKPDLVITSLDAARRIGNNNGPWARIANVTAHQKPARHAEWPEVLASIEMQYTKAIDQADVDSYRNINEPFQPADAKCVDISWKPNTRKRSVPASTSSPSESLRPAKRIKAESLCESCLCRVPN